MYLSLRKCVEGLTEQEKICDCYTIYGRCLDGIGCLKGGSADIFTFACEKAGCPKYKCRFVDDFQVFLSILQFFKTFQHSGYFYRHWNYYFWMHEILETKMIPKTSNEFFKVRLLTRGRISKHQFLLSLCSAEHEIPCASQSIF